MTGLRVATSDEDECICGDPRRQHRDGKGPCVFNKPEGIGHGGASNCDRFTLFPRALQQPADEQVGEGR